MIATIGRFLDPWEAHVIRARLEAEGIPANLAFDNHSIANWPFSLALGGTAVQVPVAFYEQALEVVHAYRSGLLEQDLLTETGIESEHCAKCGSTDFRRTIPTKQRTLALFLGLFTSALFPTSLSQLICNKCGFRWRADEG
jgi:hypothetical protein